MAVIIAFEGIDGSGKTVQMEHLKRTLQARGLHVLTMSFPVYTSFFGEHVGEYLTGADGTSAMNVDQKSMALWFALDRFAAFRAFGEKRLMEADVLLINRYVLSNAVYQSIRDIDLKKPDLLDFIFELEHTQLQLPQADLYIYLDVNIEEAGQNVRKKGYREYTGDAPDLYEAQTEIQLRAREKYLAYAKTLPFVEVVYCMQKSRMRDQEEIAADVEKAVFNRRLF
jgi:dTMP kinase